MKYSFDRLFAFWISTSEGFGIVPLPFLRKRGHFSRMKHILYRSGERAEAD
ncbi:hypothetical protein gpAD87_04325 [Paenibacillus sp. AD87]|nr:hypothetical protein gpAD87_04325 [Paenibacillus sp. AD87]